MASFSLLVQLHYVNQIQRKTFAMIKQIDQALEEIKERLYCIENLDHNIHSPQFSFRDCDDIITIRAEVSSRLPCNKFIYLTNDQEIIFDDIDDLGFFLSVIYDH